MSPEERQQFKQNWKRGCYGGQKPVAPETPATE
jgi:hypothetical protein